MKQLSFDFSIPQPQIEIWKPFPISGYETLYEISNKGRIRSLVRRKSVRAGQFLKLNPRKNGYCEANITSVDGQREHFFVHRLVMMAFLPIDNPDNFEVNHIDGFPSNNALDNLEWCSHHINMIHYAKVLKPARDLQKIDTRTNVEKLTKAEIGFIQGLMAEQFPIEKIAAMFCVSVSDLELIPQAA